jgi:hypothetical protein
MSSASSIRRDMALLLVIPASYYKPTSSGRTSFITIYVIPDKRLRVAKLLIIFYPSKVKGL